MNLTPWLSFCIYAEKTRGDVEVLLYLHCATRTSRRFLSFASLRAISIGDRSIDRSISRRAYAHRDCSYVCYIQRCTRCVRTHARERRPARMRARVSRAYMHRYFRVAMLMRERPDRWRPTAILERTFSSHRRDSSLDRTEIEDVPFRWTWETSAIHSFCLPIVCGNL